MHPVANYDSLVRQLLGQPAFDTTLQFKLSTLKENVALLSEELLEEINAVIAHHSGQVIKKKDAGLSLKVDSYAFESNVHFPTDLNLAWDCARKCIELSRRLCHSYALPGWRKHANWHSRIKGQARASARACRSAGKNRSARIETSVQAYLQSLYALEEKVLGTVEELSAVPMEPMLEVSLSELRGYQDLLIHHIFLISDRLLDGRKIASGQKLYSIFEQHTEWIQKGKAHGCVELGSPFTHRYRSIRHRA